jgi:hypothetical protein
MDVWEFAAHSEWPIVVGGAVWFLRRSLREMMGRINPTKVDAWGFKAEFDKTLEKVEILTSEKASNPTMAMDSTLETEKPKPAALEAPEIKILRAWNDLEVAMRKASPARRPGIKWITPKTIDEAAKDLKLGEDEIAAVNEMRELRNKVAHTGFTVLTRADAARYYDAANELIRRVSNVA